ncbi:MAG: hypothetical protein LBN95_07950 [Prevotellaceae bacterium]|jgi:type II secretory pathway component PulC|nr:hypothetical protein [Prevotellaceae bacterium]
MKAGADIIIYVAIIVISIISSIVKSISKKKETVGAPSQPKPQQTAKRSLEDIFRELVEVPQQPQPKPVVVAQPVVKQPVVQPKPQFAVPVMNDGFALEKHNYNHVETSQNSGNQIDLQLNNAADWQKAFIYSEIFNRKY